MRWIRRSPRIPRLRRGCEHTVTNTGMALINARGVVFNLPRSGAIAVPALLRGGVSAATAALRHQYKITSDRAAADVQNLLQQLVAARIVR